jgi:hypothetical protein
MQPFPSDYYGFLPALHIQLTIELPKDSCATRNARGNKEFTKRKC